MTFLMPRTGRPNRFFTDARGNVTIMLAFSMIGILGAGAAAIDYVRWTNAKAQMNAALDGAVLAGTQTFLEKKGDSSQALAVARKYYATAMATATPLQDSTVDFRINSKVNGVAAFGQAALETTILKVVGIDSLPLLPAGDGEVVTAESGQLAPSSDLEVGLMLDVTGSMCDDNTGPCASGDKISALKSAAKSLVDTVVWQDQSQFTSRVALVPFATRIRLAPDGSGASIMKSLTNMDAKWSGYFDYCVTGTGTGGSEDGGNWVCTKSEVQYHTDWDIMPCVTDRFYESSNDIDYTDDAPGPGKWLNGHDGTRMTVSRDSSNSAATSQLGKTAADPATHWNYRPGGGCADMGASTQVLPLTNDKTLLKSRIDALEAYGSTGGALGTAFTWYMLSPLWNTIWTGPSAPKGYDLMGKTSGDGTPKLRKIAILMTDGVYNTARGWKDVDPKLVSDGAAKLCTAMKAKGIEIYTVGFALNTLAAGEKATALDMLKSCATDDAHFYDSQTSAQLVQAFKDIGNDVAATQTRLVK